MPLFNISDLIWDETIYPRSARKQPTIDAYSEALAAGAAFPPIIIQPVVNFPAPNTSLTDILMLILDGIHRWSACKVLGLTEIEAVLWQDQPLDYAACKDDLLLESARRNISHGDLVMDPMAGGGVVKTDHAYVNGFASKEKLTKDRAWIILYIKYVQK